MNPAISPVLYGNRICLILALSVATVLPPAGCARDGSENGRATASVRTRYLLNYITPPDSNLWVYLNGEPVCNVVGEKSGILDITPFVINGRNDVEVNVSPNAADISPYDKVTIWTADPDPNPKEVARIEWSELGRSNECVRVFSAEVPWRWQWQSGQAIETLTDEDKSAILALLTGLRRALESRDYDACLKLQSRWLPEDTNVALPRPQAAALRELEDAERRAVAMTARVEHIEDDAVRFVVGSRLVRIQASDESAFLFTSVATDPLGTYGQPMNLREDHRYFSKIDGKWQMFVLNWTY